jgi:plastocyanin
MHSAALHLAPVLAAEKSKVPFFIAGGVLVAWALIVSLGLGLRRANFPGSLQGERATIAVTVVLVLAAVSTAVITSGSSATAHTATSSAQAPSASGGLPSAPAPSTSTATSTQPQATTGSPAAPKRASAGTKKTTGAAPSGATTALALIANPQGLLSYDAKKLSAKAGTVTITLQNNAPLEHNLTIAKGAKVLGATPTFMAGNRQLTLKLAPGTYTFYCSVPGHRQAGMEGTLSVS